MIQIYNPSIKDWETTRKVGYIKGDDIKGKFPIYVNLFKESPFTTHKQLIIKGRLRRTGNE